MSARAISSSPEMCTCGRHLSLSFIFVPVEWFLFMPTMYMYIEIPLVLPGCDFTNGFLCLSHLPISDSLKTNGYSVHVALCTHLYNLSAWEWDLLCIGMGPL